MKTTCKKCRVPFAPEECAPDLDNLEAIEPFFDIDELCEGCVDDAFKFLENKAEEFL